MASLDVEKILTGTPEKAFLAARKALADEYNETTANEFFYTYCEQPLSFILKHSREIFSETYFGYDFYLDLIDQYTYDPRVYVTEAEKVRNYVDEAREKKLPQSQIDKYDILLERIISYSSATTNLRKCFEIAGASEGVDELLEIVFDCMYDIDRGLKSENKENALEVNLEDMKNNICSSIFSVANVYCKIVAGFEFCSRYKSYTPYLVEATREIMNDNCTNDHLGNIQRLEDCVSTMLKDDIVVDKLKSMQTLAEYWFDITSKHDSATEKAGEILTQERDEILAVMQDQNPISADSDAVYQISNIGSDDPSDVQEKLLCTKYDNLSRLRSIYEAKSERASVEGGLIAENAEDILCSIEAEMTYMEWEDDGSPNAVIRQHIMTSKERADAQAEKEKEKNTMRSILAENNEKRSEEIDNESDLCNKIKDEINHVGNVDGLATGAANEEDIKQVLKSARSNLDKYRKIAKEKNYKRAIALCDDLEDEIKVSDPMYESFATDVDKRLAMFMEEFHEEAEDNRKGEQKEKPVKPKTDLATKIQNKALDRAAKDEKRLAKSKEQTQKLKNAANAVSSTPKRVSDDLKKFVSDFDKWDDNRRKEFLLKPGYRHKIIKHFKNALMLGSVASINLACVPMFALLHHCSKIKDKRIRNELARELENEIHICEEKINDANSAGDNKSKYELMRIKDKLEAEKIRVRVNSNYM